MSRQSRRVKRTQLHYLITARGCLRTALYGPDETPKSSGHKGKADIQKCKAKPRGHVKIHTIVTRASPKGIVRRHQTRTTPVYDPFMSPIVVSEKRLCEDHGGDGGKAGRGDGATHGASTTGVRGDGRGGGVGRTGKGVSRCPTTNEQR